MSASIFESSMCLSDGIFLALAVSRPPFRVAPVNPTYMGLHFVANESVELCWRGGLLLSYPVVLVDATKDESSTAKWHRNMERP
jgi:hypothetical protein